MDKKTTTIVKDTVFLIAMRSIRKSPLFIFGVIAVILAITVPNFLSIRNFINLFTQASALGLMALGMTFVLILGGIDLSIPATMAFSGIIGAMYMRDIGSPVIACIIMILIGTCVGCINGLAVSKLNMIPFIVTLSMQAILTGSSIWLTNNDSVYNLPQNFESSVLVRISMIPLPVFILIFVTAVIHILLKKNIYGRWLYSVGINRDAAKVCGVKANNVVFSSYVISGFFAGVAAVIITARLNSASATMGSENIVLDIISSAVIGGVSIYGGIGTAIGAVVGAVFITIISNSMNLLHIPYYLTLVIKGMVIISVIAIDSLRVSKRR